MYYTPSRDTGVKIMIDTNAINARQLDPAINQLETWRKNGVIMLLMPDCAYAEASIGGDHQRDAKAATMVRTNSARISPEQQLRYSQIEQALFPAGTTSKGQRNDVEIVYQAADWGYILVTNDGNSRNQPRGILGARDDLSRLHVTVLRPEEAVAYICGRIADRDARVTANCEAMQIELPSWIGDD